MVTLENLVIGLLPSNPSGLASSSSNQVPDQGRSLNKIVHPFPSPLEDTRTIIERAFSDRLQGPALLSPLREDDAELGSDLPVAGGAGFEHGSGVFSTASAASSEAMVWVMEGWSWEQVVGVVLVAVIVPFIVVSNLLVVVSVARFKRLQMPTNCFIVWLAAVDMGVALLTPAFIVMELLPGQVVSPVLCLSPNRVLMTACGVSVLTMAAIAYDRHTALVSPLKYVSVMTPRKIALLLTSVCLYSAAIVWLPLLLGWFSSSTQGGNTLPCSFQLLQDRAHVLFLGAIFGPACLAITVCYFRIYTVARQHARAIAAMESSVQHNLRARVMIRDAKYAKTLGLVIGAFLALWAPYLLCLLAQVLGPSVRVSPWLWNYLTLLAVLNSGLNPWIYAFKNNDFRTAFARILRACCGACCPGRSCCGIFKDSRRSSSLSGVNIFTTMATSACQSRFSQGSGAACGRLSDVSYVISVGGVDSDGKIFNANRRHSLASRRRHSLSSCRRHSVANYRHSLLNHRNSLADYRSSLLNHRDSLKIYRSAVPNHRQSLNASVPATGTSLRSAAESTESSVSTLLNVDSRAFIKDLLNLYLHHSLLHPHADSESGEVEDGELGDQADPGPPVYRSDRTDQACQGGHSDHSCQRAQSRHGYINCVYQPDGTENAHSYHTELTYHSDHDHAYHSDHTEDACSSSHANHPSHSSHAFQSEHADDSCYSDYSDHSYHGDDTDHCNHGDPTNSSHQGEPCDYSYQSDCTQHTSHGDVTDSVHRHSKEDKESMCKTDVSKQCIIELTQHGDHTDRGYHSDHSDHVKHSI